MMTGSFAASAVKVLFGGLTYSSQLRLAAARKHRRARAVFGVKGLSMAAASLVFEFGSFVLLLRSQKFPSSVA
ncbi:hypothetical protein [Adlercreutzia sp. ZJ305]|uniref:hypothetical protein n=1 Tax=Adlercreutzia sp. ZJ305 TaxID=2709408 RepID=UPI0013EC62EA|nr:hypothetical protein [Adlercreutzia sp. ZJ305]